MRHYSKEQMQQARKADLYDYMLRNHANCIKREGRSIHLVDNHSLSIKQGYSGYLDFATGEKGNSVDFLVRYMGYALDQAVFALCKDGCALDTSFSSSGPVIDVGKPSSPVFPAPAEGRYRQLFAYLTGRGIPATTIQWLVSHNLLYQDKARNNAVFINLERDWAELRGTYTYGSKAFHGVASGCRPDGFWWFWVGENMDVAYICESAIDAISLYILHGRRGLQHPAYYVSIGGAAKQMTIDRIKGSINAVILAVDNDEAGQLCRNRNQDLEYIIPTAKDWNDDLMQSLRQAH